MNFSYMNEKYTLTVINQRYMYFSSSLHLFYFIIHIFKFLKHLMLIFLIYNDKQIYLSDHYFIKYNSSYFIKAQTTAILVLDHIVSR